jgi:hypothetical protein
MDFIRIAKSIIARNVTVKLFVGEDVKKEPFIPGYMSINPWQAIQYGPYVYEATLKLRQLESIEPNVWGLDIHPDHAYFKEKPGVFDSRMGEAIVNIPIQPNLIKGHELVKAMKEAPDFTSRRDVDEIRMFEDGPKLFGDAFPDFIEWRWSSERGDSISDHEMEEIQEVFDEDWIWTPEIEAAIKLIEPA